MLATATRLTADDGVGFILEREGIESNRAGLR